MKKNIIFFISLILLLGSVISKQCLEIEFLTYSLLFLGICGMIYHYAKGKLEKNKLAHQEGEAKETF